YYRFYETGLDEFLGSLIDSPFLAWNKRGRAVKEVLPVVHIEDRVTSCLLFIVVGGQIDHYVSIPGEKPGMKILVYFEITRERMLLLRTAIDGANKKESKNSSY